MTGSCATSIIPSFTEVNVDASIQCLTNTFSTKGRCCVMLIIPLFPGCDETVVIFSLATCQQIAITTRHAVCGRLYYESSYWMWSIWPVDSRGKCCTHQHVSHFYSAAGWSHVYLTECKTIYLSIKICLCTIPYMSLLKQYIEGVKDKILVS